MKPGKAGLQVFLPCLFNYSLTGSQQLTLKVDQSFFHTNSSYSCDPFPVTGSLEFSSQMFNEDRISLSTMGQLMQKLSPNHYSNTIRIANFLNIKTLQV